MVPTQAVQPVAAGASPQTANLHQDTLNSMAAMKQLWLTQKAKFKVGDMVSPERWDKTERPVNRIGTPAVITGMEPSVCESGYMCSISGPLGIGYLDQNWLTPFPKPFTGNTDRNLYKARRGLQP